MEIPGGLGGHTLAHRLVELYFSRCAYNRRSGQIERGKHKWVRPLKPYNRLEGYTADRADHKESPAILIYDGKK